MEYPTESPKPKITRKTVLFPLIGLVAFFAYIYLFRVDIPAIIATAQSADPLPYALAAALSLVEVFFFSVSWRVLANFLLIKLSVIKSYLFVWYGIFVDIIVPAESVSGEALRVYLIAKEQGNNTCGRVVASLVTHRLLGMGLLFTETKINPLIFNLILFLAVGITVTLLLLILFSFKEKWSLKVIDWLIRLGKFLSRGKWHWQLTKIKEDACRIAKSFHDSMKEFKHNPKALVLSLFYLILTWIFSLSIPYLVFLSLRFPVSWSAILITSAIVLAVKSIPLGIPFEVGLPEITMTTIYISLLGPEAAGISATATILTRLITLWLRFFIGFIAQQWLELKPVLAPANNIPVEKA
ncbi:MAG TPA: lysylphosphatidylglycerol synthase transmembrane domain-containing protein [Acidobacteriota bacterium]|nr:lysylphosphatidylglycerol synthase transmembrane domain-containing protein [Acidobacteriota bacterium]